MAIQIIGARAPYFNNQYDDEFNWWVTITYGADIDLTEQLLILKRSPAAGFPTALRLNVSPLAGDYFYQTPELATPSGFVEPNHGAHVDVELAANGYGSGVFAEFRAFDGWEPFLANTIAISNRDITRSIFRNTPQYISGKPFDCDNIMWLLNDGSTYVESNINFGVDIDLTWPVINPNLAITDNHTTIAVIGRDAGNNPIWRLDHEFKCPYDDEYTIGFINKWGVWEFIDVMGSRQTKLKIKRDDYVRYVDGAQKNYAVNGEYEYEFNTGWVDRGYEDIMESLLLSQTVVIYKGDGSMPESIVVQDTDIDIQDSRSDKMINYNFKVTVAKPIIPIA